LDQQSGPGASTPGRRPEVNRPVTPAVPEDLNPLQRTLWDALAARPAHVDALVAGAGLEVGLVLTALTELELRGLVSQRPGMVFALIADS
jgi:predicted Rossmann fold nucleotide-binding protein DprA/Smf involved in DNA uptake